MVRALGYSRNDFNPFQPGRLCRGRERWIDPYEVDEEPPELVRVVVSGAEFTDDSAADARRGINHSGLDLAKVLAAMFPRRELVAFTEDGHPADIPEDAVGVEMYSGHRSGGRSEELMVRWMKPVSGIRELREVLGEDDTGVLGFLWLQPGIEIDDELGQHVFRLVGMGCLDSPPSRFQPAALPELTEIARAVVLLHRDKHGPALGIYARGDVVDVEKAVAAAQDGDTLTVPFAIPPMLARWDRALAEARTAWMSERDDEFPVPVCAEPSSWQPRRRRRKGRKGRDELSSEADRAARAARGEDEE